ncbi:MAG: hypothetical protein ABFQ64_10170 [Campylobacterota bacterium]
MVDTQKIYDVPLHDIKEIVEVQEYSFYYLLGTVFLALLVLGVLLYLLYKYIQKLNAYNERKEHLKLLDSLDLSDTKNAAYAISRYGMTFANDGVRESEMYKNITSRLEEFKYKKSVEAFDEETLGYIELYKGMIDV